MHKNQKSSIIFIVLTLVLVAGAYFISTLQNESSSTNEGTEIISYDGVMVNREISFNEFNDLVWFDLLPIVHSQPNLIPDEKFLQNGSLVFSTDNELRGVNTKPVLTLEVFDHLRIMTSQNGPCFSAEVFSPMPNNNEISFRFSGCPETPLILEAVINSPEGAKQAPIQTHGSFTVKADQWVDLIFWINPEGDQVYCFAGDPEETNLFLYGAIPLPEEWQSESWGFSFGGFFDPSETLPVQTIEVDFLRLGKGDIRNYLFYNLPGYIDRQAEMDSFLLEDPPSTQDLIFSDI